MVNDTLRADTDPALAIKKMAAMKRLEAQLGFKPQMMPETPVNESFFEWDDEGFSGGVKRGAYQMGAAATYFLKELPEAPLLGSVVGGAYDLSEKLFDFGDIETNLANLSKEYEQDAMAIEDDGSTAFWLGSLVPSVVPTAGALGMALIPGMQGAALAAGNIAIGSLAGVSMGQGLMDYDRYKESVGEEIDPLARWGAAVGYGAAEILFERIQMGKLMKPIKANLLRGGKDMIVKADPLKMEKFGTKIMLDYLKAKPTAAKKLLKRMGTSSFTEGWTEAATELSQASIENFYRNDEDKYDIDQISERMIEAFKGGAVMGAGLGPMSFQAQSNLENKRRKDQGGVLMGRVNKTDLPVEIAGESKGKYKVITATGEYKDFDKSDIANTQWIDNDLFQTLLQSKKTETEFEEAARNHYSNEATQAAQNFVEAIKERSPAQVAEDGTEFFPAAVYKEAGDKNKPRRVIVVNDLPSTPGKAEVYDYQNGQSFVTDEANLQERFPMPVNNLVNEISGGEAFRTQYNPKDTPVADGTTKVEVEMPVQKGEKVEAHKGTYTPVSYNARTQQVTLQNVETGEYLPNGTGTMPRAQFEQLKINNQIKPPVDVVENGDGSISRGGGETTSAKTFDLSQSFTATPEGKGFKSDKTFRQKELKSILSEFEQEYPQLIAEAVPVENQDKFKPQEYEIKIREATKAELDNKRRNEEGEGVPPAGGGGEKSSKSVRGIGDTAGVDKKTKGGVDERPTKKVGVENKRTTKKDGKDGKDSGNQEATAGRRGDPATGGDVRAKEDTSSAAGATSDNNKSTGEDSKNSGSDNRNAGDIDNKLSRITQENPHLKGSDQTDFASRVLDAYGAKMKPKLERVIKSTTKGWKNIPDYEIYNSTADYNAQTGSYVPTDVEGFYDPGTGKYVFFASHPNMTSMRRIEQVIWHEAFGHAGVRNLAAQAAKDKGTEVKEELDNLLKDVYVFATSDNYHQYTNKLAWHYIYHDKGQRYDPGVDYTAKLAEDFQGEELIEKQNEIAEEFLAKHQEIYQEKTFGDKIIAAIRKIMRALTGKTSRLSDDDIFDILRDSRRTIEVGGITVASPAYKDRNLRFSLAGPIGAKNNTEIDQKRSVAEKLDDEGVSSKEIFIRTGWEKGVDDKWRYDLDSSEANIKISPEKIKKALDELNEGETIGYNLEDFFYYPSLYELYPEMRKFPVLFWELPKNVTASYGELKGEPVILINKDEYSGDVEKSKNPGNTYQRDRRRITSVLHELQHFIQAREGFPVGSRESQELEEAVQTFSKEHGRHPVGVENLDLKLEANDNYWKTAGEVEARNVEYRYDLPGREIIPPSESEFIPRDEQRIRYSRAFSDEVGNDWYSNSMRVVNNLNLPKAPADQWTKTLLNNGAAKAELDWMGWDEFAKGTKTKEEVLEFMEQNKIDLLQEGDMLLATREDEVLSAVFIEEDGDKITFKIHGDKSGAVERKLVRYAAENGFTKVQGLKILKGQLDPLTASVARAERMPLYSRSFKVEDVSNYTENNYKQTETEAFKNWFGDSKVVDENGEPLVVYHGSRIGGITVFDKKLAGKGVVGVNSSGGFYFTSTRNNAEFYADPVVVEKEEGVELDESGDVVIYGEEGAYYLLIQDEDGVVDINTGPYESYEAARSAGGQIVDKYNQAEEGEVVFEDDKIFETYLSIQNPKVVDNVKDFRAAEETAQSEGYDGIIAKDVYDGGELSDIFVVFEPTQIKSATGNQGTFDPSNPDIRFSRSLEPELNFQAKRADWIVSNWQDRFHILKKWQELESPGKLDDAMNAYQAENLSKGIVNDKIDELEAQHFKPLNKLLRSIEKQAPYDETSRYLKAKHIVEDKIEAGGISMEEAKNIISEYEAKVDKSTRNELHKSIRKLNDFTNEQERASGLISGKEFSNRKKRFNFYVPLRGFVDVDLDKTVFTQNKSRKGRESESADPLPYLYAMAQTAIVKGEQNKVKQALGEFVKEFPNSDVYALRNTYYTPVMENGEQKLTEEGQPEFEEVAERPDKDFYYKTDSLPEDAVIHYMDEAIPKNRIKEGLEGQHESISYMEDGRRIVVDMFGPEGVRVAQAFKNTDLRKAQGIFTYMRRFNDFLRGMYTQYSPEFIFRNFVRDMTTGMVNVRNDHGSKVAGEIFADVPKSWRTLWRIFAKDALAGKVLRFKENTQDAKYAREFMENGAMTGYSDLKNVSDIQKQLKKNIEGLQSNASRVNPVTWIKWLGNGIDSVNRVFENSVRFSAYKRMRKMGLTESQAAMYAKDLTVNFNRKGAWSDGVGAFYLFFNASVQGNDRLLRPFGGVEGAIKAIDTITPGENKSTLSDLKGVKIDKKVRNRAIGTLLALPAANFAVTMMSRMFGGEDDDGDYYYDKLSEYTRTHNIVIPDFQGEGGFITIPLPYGYNVLLGGAEHIGRVLVGKDKPGDAAVKTALLVTESFSPLGSPKADLGEIESTAMEYITPTAFKPMFELVVNSNFAGIPIYKEGSPYGTPPPPHKQYYNGVNPITKELTDALAQATGGDDIVPGHFDINPEKIDHLVGTYMGGVGKFLNDASATALNYGRYLSGQEVSKDELDPRRMPFVRNYSKKVSPNVNRSIYFENSKDVKRVSDIARRYVQGGEMQSAREFRQDNRDILTLDGYRKNLDKKIEKLNDRVNLLKGKPDKVKELESLEAQLNDLYKDFNKRYNKALGRTNLLKEALN